MEIWGRWMAVEIENSFFINSSTIVRRPCPQKKRMKPPTKLINRLKKRDKNRLLFSGPFFYTFTNNPRVEFSTDYDGPKTRTFGIEIDIVSLNFEPIAKNDLHVKKNS